MQQHDATIREDRKIVGVTPPAALQQRTRLWRVLEDAFPVTFEGRDPSNLTGLDALVAHRVDIDASAPLPTLQTSADESPNGSVRIDLSKAASLERCLRGQQLADSGTRDVPALRPTATETILATRDASPLWVVNEIGDSQYRAAALPANLGKNEPLRDRLRAGRFLALLPILTLLRELTQDTSWTAPPLRATLMFDDPNLHWTSYGYLDYADLAFRAQSENFHVAFATVPIDGWFAHRAAIRLFREHNQLSLLMHGNDHLWCELGKAVTRRSSLMIAAQALRRIDAFERRTGLYVSRVMAPPHGECSFEMFHALRRTGFTAACISRPYPWLERAPATCPLTQWQTADLVDGLPVLSRYSITKSTEDLPFRAFLRQPLILYGHQRDLAKGDPVGEIAGAVNRLGDVQWSSMASIAKSSFLTRRVGDTLKVRLYTRGAEIAVPPGVRRLVLEAPAEDDTSLDDEFVTLASDTQPDRPVKPGEALEIGQTERLLRLSVSSPDCVDVSDVPARRRRLWPGTRRLLVEGRDRLAPTLDLARRP